MIVTADAGKTRIYYPRTYRRYIKSGARQWLFVFIFAVPLLVLLLFGYNALTAAVSSFVISCLSPVMTGESLKISSSDFLPFFGDVNFVGELPTVYPDFSYSVLCFAATLALLLLCMRKKRGSSALAIYLSMNLLILLISTIYFALVPYEFPYTADEYSELYMEQQLGTWIFILIMMGVILGFLSNHSLMLRALTFFGILLYSFVFGCVRYLTFLIIIYKCTIIFMPSLFFTLGPLFDFIYVVYLYSAFAGRVIKKTNEHNGREAFEWL